MGSDGSTGHHPPGSSAAFCAGAAVGGDLPPGAMGAAALGGKSGFEAGIAAGTGPQDAREGEEMSLGEHPHHHTHGKAGLSCGHHQGDNEFTDDCGHAHPLERAMCVAARRSGSNLRQALARRQPHYPPGAEDPMFVQELLADLPPGENANAVLSVDQLELNGLYRIGDWSLCLMEKSKDGKVRFKSVEQHFDLGHLQFTLTPEQVAAGAVGPDDIFGTEEEALDYLDQGLRSDLGGPRLQDVFSDDEGGCGHHHHHHHHHWNGAGDDEGSETVDVEYWDELFEQQEHTNSEWLVSYSTIAQYVTPFLRPTDEILVVGCGNSDLSVGLWEDGFKAITSMDISGVVIEQMREKFAHCDGLKWDTEDVLDMSYEDSSFDTVVDKSLLDCIFHCGQHSEKVANMLAEVHRVLRKGTGVALYVTTQGPTEVMPFLEEAVCGTWVTETHRLTVETDKQGNVPRLALSALGDGAELDCPYQKHFHVYVCCAIVEDSVPETKRQR